MSFPPPPFTKLTRRLIRGPGCDVVLGDLEEGYYRRLESGRSSVAARVWFIVQTLSSALAMERARRATAPPPRKRCKGDDRMSQLKDELRLALKSLWRRPGYAVPIVLTLGLGMGVSATVFSVVEAPTSPTCANAR